jgi:hypothetical protein
MPTKAARNPFSPTLFNSEVLAVSEEQKEYIRELLKICCSDSQFANKAYNGLVAILTAGSVVAPSITSLSPSSAAIGSPVFDLHVIGTGFTPASKIVFNGIEEPTTYVSATELTTGINMPLWQAPVIVPVTVTEGDLISDQMLFEFTASTPELVSSGVGTTKSPEISKVTKTTIKV